MRMHYVGSEISIGSAERPPGGEESFCPGVEWNVDVLDRCFGKAGQLIAVIAKHGCNVTASRKSKCQLPDDVDHSSASGIRGQESDSQDCQLSAKTLLTDSSALLPHAHGCRMHMNHWEWPSEWDHIEDAKTCSINFVASAGG